MKKLKKERRRKADTAGSGSDKKNQTTWCQLLRSDYDKICAKVKIILLGMKYSADEVDEISQRVIVKLWKISKPAPRAWPGCCRYLYMTCSCCAAAYFDEKNRVSKLKDTICKVPNTIEDQDRESDLSLALEEALSILTPLHRRIIELRFFESRSYAEIAKIVGIKASNVGLIIHRGVKKELSQAKCLDPFNPHLRSP